MMESLCISEVNESSVGQQVQQGEELEPHLTAVTAGPGADAAVLACARDLVCA